MPSGTFHYYLVTKLNADATSRTRQLHCYVVKFRFTSLYGNWQIDLDLHLTGSRIPGYINMLVLHFKIKGLGWRIKNKNYNSTTQIIMFNKKAIQIVSAAGILYCYSDSTAMRTSQLNVANHQHNDSFASTWFAILLGFCGHLPHYH